MRMGQASWSAMLSQLGFLGERERARSTRRYSRRLRFEQCEDRRMLAPYMVTNNGDAQEGTPAAIGTLRQAIFDANNNPGPDTITFSTDPADGLNGGTITLTQGELSITDSVTIDASMLPGGITIDASGADPTPDPGDGIRIFNITDPTFGSNPPLVTLKKLSLTGGDVTGSGGAISSTASLSIQDCIITGNHATGLPRGNYVVGGGGISFNGKDLEILTTTIKGNTSTGYGGGLAAKSSEGTITISQSKFETNTTNNTPTAFNRDGAGAFLTAYNSSISIAATTVSGNRAESPEANDASASGGGVFGRWAA